MKFIKDYHMDSKIKSFNLFFLLAFLTFILSSCSSSKNIANDPIYNPSGNEQLLSKDEIKLIKEAKSWIGTKYKYGGHSREGTDCSGFVLQVYKAVYDLKLPRSSKEQYTFCKKISKNKMRVGDLVFFATGKSKDVVSHVGIYIGNNEFIHASSSKGVVISNLDQNYYVRTFVSAGKVERKKK